MLGGVVIIVIIIVVCVFCYCKRNWKCREREFVKYYEKLKESIIEMLSNSIIIMMGSNKKGVLFVGYFFLFCFYGGKNYKDY